jgi:hypothetical protein
MYLFRLFNLIRQAMFTERLQKSYKKFRQLPVKIRGVLQGLCLNMSTCDGSGAKAQNYGNPVPLFYPLLYFSAADGHRVGAHRLASVTLLTYEHTGCGPPL